MDSHPPEGGSNEDRAPKTPGEMRQCPSVLVGNMCDVRTVVHTLEPLPDSMEGSYQHFLWLLMMRAEGGGGAQPRKLSIPAHRGT